MKRTEEYLDIAIAGGGAAATGISSPGHESLLDLPGDLLDMLPAAVYVCDTAGLIVRCNRKAVELWGRTPKLGDREDRFCGSWRMYRLDGGPLPHEECPMADVLRTGQVVRDQEVVIERSDGSRITALVNISPLRNTAGAIVGAVNCFQDITERKRAEAAQRERERQFRGLFDALPAAVYTTDAAGRITYYNQAAVDLSGNRPKLGSDEWCVSWRLYWPDGRPMPHDQCPMAVALKEDRPVRGGEAIAERPDGSRISFIAYPTPLHDESGALVGAVNMLVDITERKQAEERTRLLIHEVDHRAKNMLATVQAIARMTRAETVPAFVDALMGRLDALSRAHSLLAESRWAGADLRRLVEEELAAYRTGDGGRVTISGPALALCADAAQVLAMALHELATNAAKYGALSTRGGHVAVEWSWDSDGRLALHWTETGGPPIRTPGRRGFGSRMIQGVVSGQLDGAVQLDWPVEGLACRITIPRGKLLDGTARAPGS